MGKYNEIQEETTQSWGSNSFTTTVKEDTVEFDSAKDKFTFKDEVEVPSLKVNGQPVGPAEPQQQADWNQSDDTKADYIKNRICYDNGFSATYLTNETAAFAYEDSYTASFESAEPTVNDVYLAKVRDEYGENEQSFYFTFKYGKTLGDANVPCSDQYYTVDLDGTSAHLVCTYYNGNLGITLEGDGTNEGTALIDFGKLDFKTLDKKYLFEVAPTINGNGDVEISNYLDFSGKKVRLAYDISQDDYTLQIFVDELSGWKSLKLAD